MNMNRIIVIAATVDFTVILQEVNSNIVTILA